MLQGDERHDVQHFSTAEEARSTAQSGSVYLAEVERRLTPYFERAEPRRRAITYVQGLLSPAERKNSWQLAEVSGDATPYGLQHLLGRALWQVDAVRDELRSYIVQHLGDAPAGLVIDETGFLKKGHHSTGVARQYSGTAGRIENCQVGVFLTYASRYGHAFIDRELYLPKAWVDEPTRCRRVGIPDARRFATKPQLARQMLARALAARVPARWVAGDSMYGDDRRLRMWSESCPQAYLLAVSGKEYVWLGWQQRQAKAILAALPADGWTRHSAGAGSKGPREYDWRRLTLAEPLEPGWCRWLLVRRSVSEPGERAAYVVFAPHETTLEDMVRVAGMRWTIESCFEAAKREVGLDHYEVRSWTGWYRHITLAMWALALLTVLRAGAIAVEAFKKSPRSRPSSLTAFKAQRGLQSP
jgi:SRSO17 transposase